MLNSPFLCSNLNLLLRERRQLCQCLLHSLKDRPCSRQSVAFLSSGNYTAIEDLDELSVFSFFQNASGQYLGEVFFDVSLFVHCGFLTALTYRGLCSAFISAVWVAFPLLTKLCVQKDLKQHGRVFLVAIQTGNALKYIKASRNLSPYLILLGRLSKLLLF